MESLCLFVENSRFESVALNLRVRTVDIRSRFRKISSKRVIFCAAVGTGKIYFPFFEKKEENIG